MQELIPPTVLHPKINRRAFYMARAEETSFFVNVYPSKHHEHGIKYAQTTYIGNRRPRRIPGRRVLYRVRVTPK